jgi:hypothetical protein
MLLINDLKFIRHQINSFMTNYNKSGKIIKNDKLFQGN